MSMEELPRGWIRARVSHVAEVRLGRQCSPANRAGEYARPYLRAANVTWDGLDLADVNTMDFRPSEFASYELHPGDILLSEASGSASEVGKPAIWRGEIPGCCFQNTLIRVRSLGPLPEFLRYRFLSDALSGRFVQASRGIGIHHLGAGRLSELEIEVPPLAEQRRIVAAIEEHLSDIDAGVASLQRVQANLKRYRASVLKAAVEGRLTMGTEQWRSVPLGELLREPLRNGKSGRASSSAGGVRTLTLTAVTTGDFSAENTKITLTTPAEAKGLWLESGDIFIQRSNTPELVGTARLYRGQSRFAIFPDLLIRVRVNEANAVPEFVELVLHAVSTRRFFRARAQGIAGSMPKIDQPTVEATPIPLPAIEQQREIVKQARNLLANTEAASRAVSLGLRRADRLRQSILKRAFEGKLVPQDPNDVPASALLEQLSDADVRPRRKAVRKSA